jgi:AraC-like DNA-binding protein
MVAVLDKIAFDESGGFRTEYINEANGFWHFHPEYEIVLNTKSNGTRIVGDSVELFDYYDLVLIGSNIPHCWNYYRKEIAENEKSGITLHFKLSSFGEPFLSQHEMRSVRDLLADSERGLVFSTEDARKAETPLLNMVHKKGIEKMICLFDLFKILSSSEKKSFLCSESYKLSFDEHGNKKMTEVYNYIRENFSKPISLDKISKIAHMSPFSFSRFFKKNCGAGFVEYLNSVRMNKACHFLRETDYHVCDISADCGFSSISNFNKKFRKTEGISPREYRARFR